MSGKTSGEMNFYMENKKKFLVPRKYQPQKLSCG